MTPQNLLLELFVEELPPKALKKLGESFAAALTESLRKDGLADAASLVTPYASPRRLAAHITGVLPVAADKPVVQKLMPVSVGLDASGKPTPALLKKLAALGAGESAVSGLRREHDGKAEVLFYDSVAKGATLAEGLQKALEAALAALPIPKVMTYQLADGWTTVNFVRPAHGLVALHGAEIVPITTLGLTAGRTTQGHRFEAAVDPVAIRHADEYAATLLAQGAVIASFAERRAEIARQLTAQAAKASEAAGFDPLSPKGFKPIEDDALLDEVTALVERPNVLIGQFEPEFLAVPQECLILTMKANQKYFPLLDAAGKLTHQFLVVSNISPADPSAVIQGNERVVRPRLADAKFFFDQDRKKTLGSRVVDLSKVVYHNQLGTQGERTQRVRAIARGIAQVLDIPQQAVEIAANLAKADLLTDMVGEFPELQGIMGRYYALHDGLSEDIADAVEDHYKPRFSGDSLPRNRVGTVVALADKLETLVGLFGIGQIPTGDKDPFALRRHALGVIRMLSEEDLPLPLDALLALAAEVFSGISGFAYGQEPLLNFIYDRLAGSLREQGYTAQEVDAVVSQRPQRLGDIPKRLAAVRAFAALPEAEALAAANKRVGNILKKSSELSTVQAEPVEAQATLRQAQGERPLAQGERPLSQGERSTVNAALLVEAAEIALHAALASVKPQADAAFEAGDYTASLQALAALREPVDTFFTEVMVNADDPALKANRLGLLATLHAAMNRVADLSRLSS